MLSSKQVYVAYSCDEDPIPWCHIEIDTSTP